MKEFLVEHVIPNAWGAIGAIVGAIWLWWTQKPKEKVEQDGGIVDNAKKVLEMSEDIAERLQKQLIQSDEVITQLKEKLRTEIEEGQIGKKHTRSIEKELAEWKRICDEQKIEIEALKEKCWQLQLTIENYESNKIDVSGVDPLSLN